MVKFEKLKNLEYAEAILNSPDFLENLKHHEDYIKNIIKNAKELLEHCKNLTTPESELQKKQAYMNFFEKFTIGVPFDIYKNKAIVLNKINDVIKLINGDITTFNKTMMRILKDLFVKMKKIEKETLNSKRNGYKKQMKEYSKQLEKYLNDNTGKIKDDGVVKKETQEFQCKCIEYVYAIKKVEVEWFLYFINDITKLPGKFIISDSQHKNYQRLLNEILKSSDRTIEETDNADMKILEELSEYIYNRRASNCKLSEITYYEGYLNLLNHNSSTMHFCKYEKNNKKIEMLEYNQFEPKQNAANIKEYTISECEEPDENTNKRFVFKLTCKSTKGFVDLTVQALSNEEFENWFYLLDKNNQPYILDGIGGSLLSQ